MNSTSLEQLIQLRRSVFPERECVVVLLAFLWFPFHTLDLSLIFKSFCGKEKKIKASIPIPSLKRMPFSHHSHSGQFCLHAQDTLEQMIEAAIAKGMIVFSLTEHMPRDRVEDLYPEEVGFSFFFIIIVPVHNPFTFSGICEKRKAKKNHKNFFYFASNNSFSPAPHFYLYPRGKGAWASPRIRCRDASSGVLTRILGLQ